MKFRREIVNDGPVRRGGGGGGRGVLVGRGGDAGHYGAAIKRIVLTYFQPHSDVPLNSQTHDTHSLLEKKTP